MSKGRLALASLLFSLSLVGGLDAAEAREQHDIKSLVGFWEKQEHNEATKLKADEEAAKEQALQEATQKAKVEEAASQQEVAADGSEVSAVEVAQPKPPKKSIQVLPSDEILIIDDFNGGVRSNLLGGAIGEWSKDEYDDTQGCEFDFVERPRLGKGEGYSMQISYDVDSPSQAYNGVWIKLEGVDASDYKYLVMYLKAPNYPPYGTSNLKLELKNKAGETGTFKVKRIPRGAWREYKIPLKKFKGLKDLSSLKELIIVFEDKTADPKEGFVFLEHLYFTKGQIQRPH
jgi:hypothetical protein